MTTELHRPTFAAALGTALGGLVLLALAALAVDQYTRFALQHELEAKVLTQPTPELDRLHADEAARLSRYQWVDRQAGVVRIPVGRALELTVRDWRPQ